MALFTAGGFSSRNPLNINQASSSTAGGGGDADDDGGHKKRPPKRGSNTASSVARKNTIIDPNSLLQVNGVVMPEFIPNRHKFTNAWGLKLVLATNARLVECTSFKEIISDDKGLDAGKNFFAIAHCTY